MQAADTSSLDAIMLEEEFLGLLDDSAQDLLALNPEGYGDELPSKRSIYRLTDEANELESFLDDYGARHNKQFSHFTELVACIRGFSLATYSLAHLYGRLDLYALHSTALAHREQFRVELMLAVQTLWRSTKDLFRGLVTESGSLGLTLKPVRAAGLETGESFVRRSLPHNVDEADIVGEEGKIAEVVSRYLKALEKVEGTGVHTKGWQADARAFRAEWCTEDSCRSLETQVHNIQSKYDTYIKSTSIERGNPKLSVLRGHVSVVLHLLECATFLAHFYERHENDIRYEVTKQRIAELVNKDSVVSMIVEFCMWNGWRFLKFGAAVAEDLLGDFTDQCNVTLEIPPKVQLHARPASLIVSIVNRYGTPCELEIEGQRCDASSITQVMILSGSNAEVREVTFFGDRATLRDLELLFRAGLGELAGSELPGDLDYLV